MRKISSLTRDQLNTLQDSYANEPLQAVLGAGTVGSALAMAKGSVPDDWKLGKALGHKAVLPVGVLAGAAYGWKKAREQNQGMHDLVKTLKGKSDKETARNKLLNELEDKQFSPSSAAMQGAMAVPVLEVLPEAVSAIRKAKDYSFKGIGKGLASAVGPSLPVVAAASAIAAGAGATLRQREEREAVRNLEKRAGMNNKYTAQLVKMAEESKNRDKKSSEYRGRAVGMGILGETVGSLAMSPIAMMALKGSGVGERLLEDTPDVSEDTVRRFIHKNNLKVDISGDSFRGLSSGTYRRQPPTTLGGEFKEGFLSGSVDRLRHGLAGPAFLPTGKDSGADIIGMGGSKSKVALLHELGHAKDYSKSSSPILRMLGSRNFIPGVAGMTGMAMYGNEDTAGYTPAVIAAGQLPILREEYVASKAAYDAIKESHGTEVARKHLKRALLPAGGTYAAKAGLMVGGSAIGAWAAKRMHQKLKNEQGRR